MKATAKHGQTVEPAVSLSDRLAETANQWSGSCDVRWSVSADAERLVPRSVTGAQCVAEIVRERVGNAVRPGGVTDARRDVRVVDTGIDRSGNSARS